MQNPWNVRSIYDLQYFNCPSCVFKISSKQEFIEHAYEIHPDAIDYLMKINDNSLSDIICPWIEIKKEELNEISTNTFSTTHFLCDLGTHLEENPVDQILRIDVKTELVEDDLTEIQSEGLDSKSNLKKHMKITHVHEGMKNYKCDTCGKVCNRPGDLKKHVKFVHEGIKNYICMTCGKAFSRSPDLKKHISSVHEGTKDHRCDQCGKFFGLPENLRRHVKNVHEGRKDYRCNDCGKFFAESYALKAHIKMVHEGQRDFECDQCGKSFCTSGNLKTHIRTVHEGKKRIWM